jgi:HK97 gp10 family phage protein
MAIRTDVRVVYNRFPELTVKMVANARREERSAARLVRTQARARVGIDTGRAYLSIVAIAPRTGGHWTVTIQDALPQRGGTKPEEYTIYLEFGTRYMRAQPFWYPAIRAVRPLFVYSMRRNLFR